MQAAAARPTKSSSAWPDRPAEFAEASLTQASVAAGENTGCAQADPPYINTIATRARPNWAGTFGLIGIKIGIRSGPPGLDGSSFGRMGERSTAPSRAHQR